MLWGIALVLLVNLGAGFVRVVLGPSAEDRMIAALLLGTTGVALLLVLAEALDRPPIRDVALVLVLLAAVAAAVFVRSPGDGGEGS
jgi:multicomponent Na+:H+ antiporter subunit F